MKIVKYQIPYMEGEGSDMKVYTFDNTSQSNEQTVNQNFMKEIHKEPKYQKNNCVL
jgi:hypothetical protein